MVSRISLAVWLVTGLAACRLSSEKIDHERAIKAEQSGRIEEALQYHKRIIERNINTPLAVDSAKDAARLYHYNLKKPKAAIPYYKHVVWYSSSSNDRIEAQRKLAELNFKELLDYSQAVTEYHRLLELPHSPADGFNYRLSIARAYFYLSNFYQANTEIDVLLSQGFNKDLLFEALVLKANIYLTSKKLDEAIVTLKQIIQDYPERARADSIPLILAVTYEEQKNFPKAIETLESMKDSYPKKTFIEQRIKTLRERQSFLPGARGLKK